ncbi:distal tail protein Dit [Alkalibacillus almallahensis]|uniref:distal tail protein Dit n=1 Tax=Alkalibacillus almallahensis TaxID=1379154 RepID=UPI00141D9C48|nr:distal tail protein Dit [Alkalibacillus almallahensis]NIK10928.1 putative phage tail component-like protein [Alkalibacillus almallahensis]
MPKTLTINGERKEWLYLLRGRQEAPFAPHDIETVSAPGKDGAHLGKTNVELKQIDQPIGFTVRDEEHEQELLDELNAFLLTQENAEIQFDNVPGKTYIGRVTGSISDYSRPAPTLREGTITFLCEPYKYGPEIEADLTGQGTIINVEGTQAAKPTFEYDVLAPITFAMVSNGDDYMMIGRPIDVDSIAKEPYPEVDRWFMNTLTGWSHMTEGQFLNDEVTGGTVSGSQISVDEGAFIPDSYGSSQSGWYGPAVKTSLSKPIQDFSVTLGAVVYNNGHPGKVMAIFLDDQGDIVCSLGLINARANSKNVRALARMNDGQNVARHRVMDYQGDTGSESQVFNDSSLNIRLRREGDRFSAKTWQVRDGRQHAQHTSDIVDDNSDFQRPIEQVVLFFAKYENHDVFPMRILGLRVHESTVLADDETPYIAQEGDQILFDHDEESIYINGEDATDLKNFGASYFELPLGENELATLPDDLDGIVKYRPTYK